MTSSFFNHKTQTSKIMARIKGEFKRLKCEYKKPNPIKSDGLFFDSYGNQVKHGSEIVIEHNYNYPHWNGQKAYVNWNEKQGIYQFQVEGSISTIENFWGIHSFRVLGAQPAQKNEFVIPAVMQPVCRFSGTVNGCKEDTEGNKDCKNCGFYW